jgi:murein L,D-transpeptidase YafK
MWQSFKRFFSFQAKALQIRYNTWKMQREIERAYRDRVHFLAFFKYAASHARVAVVVVLIAVASIFLFVMAPAMAPSVLSVAKSLQRTISRAVKQPAARKAEPPKPLPEIKPEAPKTQMAQMAAPAPAQMALLPSTGSEPFVENMLYCVVANKATKTLYFLGRKSERDAWGILIQCPAIMGKNEGQKQTAGDRKTPEGIYFIIGRKDAWELNALYGPLSYVLNYPNEEDRKAGRTGQGIWIHGMPEDSSRMVTAGCIVLQNENLLALAQYLRLGIGTPVVIIDRMDVVEPVKFPDYAGIEQKRKTILNEYRQREREFTGMLTQWKSAWEAKNIDEYSQFYDQERFFGGGLSWPAWREKKQTTFEMYDTIGISLDKIRIVDFSESTAVVVFLQLYASEVSRKQNAKRMSLILSGARWLITREETFSNEEFFL